MAKADKRERIHQERMLIRERFAANVRAAREACDWTQEEVSRRCGLHLTAVSKIERGDSLSGIETIVKLADVLGSTPTDLCNGIHWGDEDQRFDVEHRKSVDHRRQEAGA